VKYINLCDLVLISLRGSKHDVQEEDVLINMFTTSSIHCSLCTLLHLMCKYGHLGCRVLALYLERSHILYSI
jgi:hypothetical protein